MTAGALKKLHKRIMLSATYQQSSAVAAELYKSDPENRLLSHQNRRRLDFEALRDSLLFTAGRLDLTEGGKADRSLQDPLFRRDGRCMA